LTLNTRKNLILLGLTLLFAVSAGMTYARAEFYFFQQRDTTKAKQDTTINQTYKPSKRPTFRQSDRYGDPFSNTTSESPLFLKDPGKMKLDVDIDTALNYTVYEKIGELNYRPTTTMSFEEFKKQQDRQQLKQYWQSKSRASDGESAVSSRSLIPKIFISPVLDRIFGGSYVELVPRGFVTLDFGASFQKVNNPNIPIRQQRNGGFEFDQQINMSVVGKIGEKLAVTANFDNNNSFDFQNNMKVEYTGFKEDILQKLEIGNVSLPLNNTLIQGAQNLFGIKAQMQFGKLNVTAIASTQRGKVSSIDLGGNGSGGTSQGKPFLIPASGYDDNRHFFLGHFFRDNYRKWIANLPQITSGVNITRVEVYVLNRNNDTQSLRNVIGLLDLGEPTRIYNSAVTRRSTTANSNDANSLFSKITQDLFKDEGNRKADGVNAILESFFNGENNNGHDFEKITGARKLSPTEYTFHKQLGYLTLTRKLQNDEAIAVAYEYTYNGKSYKVGELSEDYASLQDEDVVFLKLLRQRDLSVALRTPAWDLMMKNIYSLNVSQLERENFQLRVIYRDDRSGIDNPQLQEGEKVRDRQLIEITGLDKLNPLNDPQPDGNFDYVEGITINSQNGLIIFPFLEPFNTALREAFSKESNPSTVDYLIKKYVYDTLYRSTKADAEQFATKNKFFLSGTYSASSSKEILIPGFGVSQGSVKVFAGGIPLIENVQYTVDYTFGKVTILDESILSSGKNISVQFEQADPFSFQTRSLLGTRFDYKLSDDINIGSTLLYYNERPLVSRNAVGTEPARNVQYGVDFNVNKTSRILTKIVDALPFVQTKETSSVNVSGEFAQLLPGTSNVIDGEGTGYIDDFENTATPYSLLNVSSWKLAATPKSSEFVPSGVVPTVANDIRINNKRAKLAWYTVDNLFYRQGGSLKPDAITDKVYDNHYMRYVSPWEVFPKKNRTQGAFFEQVFDMAYYPSERGPYNYNVALNADGRLPNPKENWAGITTAVRTEVDFDKANVEYVEFWMLDPFITGDNGIIEDGSFNSHNTKGGKLIFQLGNISEDVARDSKHAFENGLPSNGILTDAKAASKNNFGYVTNQQYLTNAFDNSTDARKYQDVGFDGIASGEEQTFFKQNYLDLLQSGAKAKVIDDPSGDDFKYFLDPSLDNAKILERYKGYNGQEGNTPVISGGDRFTPSGSPYPDNEDINQDNTLSELEEYYSYDIDLKPGQLAIGKEYVVDKITTDDNHAKENVTWYLFRIPVREFESRYGDINGFKSIRYARMILTGWEEPVVLRMVNFRMVGSKWRQYQYNVPAAGLTTNPENAVDDFTLSVVNLEENSQGDAMNDKSPYVIPPGVVRDRDNSSTIYRQLNEQSVQMCIENLPDGDGRAIYKNVTVDLFNYGRVKMYFHVDSRLAKDGDLHGFLRLGTDFDQNYYEVEIPLKVSQVGTTMSAEDVWPEENNIDLDLNELYALKAARDREGKPLGEPYPTDGPKIIEVANGKKYLIRIFGRPDLSDVKLMMIGAKNPKTPDRQSFRACIWANELRVTDFNRKAGWAVNGMVSAKLADFATVNGAFRHTTFGFGSVSSKIGERTRDESTRFDVSANVNLEKLLPGNTGIKLPMFVSYENTTVNPNYDPANPDMKLDAAMKSFSTDSARQSFKKLIQSKTVGRSINFTNVRKVKVKPDAKTHIYDIENLSFSYKYSDQLHTDYFIKEELRKTYGGSVGYNFAPKATGIEPFKNSKLFKSPWLKLIKEFNFSLMPSNISVRGDLDRSFSKKVYRNAPSTPGGEFQFSNANYLKFFTFNRAYNVAWSFSKNLSLEYNSTVNTVIDEPAGEIDTEENKAAVIRNLKNFGRMKNFQQAYTLNYTLPLDKIPVTDFLGAEYRYQASYNWKAGPNVKEDTTNQLPDFGNTIQNTRENNVTGKIDLVKLYNKVKFLKELNTPPKPKPPVKPGTRVKQEVDTVKSMPGIVKGFLRLVMSLRSINASYTLTEGTTLFGFAPSAKLFGMDKDYSAPGWGFILGSQDPNIRFRAAENGWLTKAEELTNPFTQMQNKTLDIKGNLEPSQDLKVQINLRKENSNAYQEIYRYDNKADGWASLSPSRTGSYKISFISIKTAFDKTNDDKESNVFKQFEKNLDIIRTRMLALNPDITNDEDLDTTAQDVTVAAFLAAYTGKDAHTSKLGSFPKLPLPNWRLDYTGLSKWNMFKETFQSITVSHAYQSSYSVSNYSNSLQYSDTDLLGIDVNIEDYNNGYYGRTIDGKYVPIYVLGQVFISEQFSPLVGVNVKTKGRLSMNFQYKTKRDLALNITNAQITELNSKDVSFELGYTKNNLKLPFKVQGETIILKNDVTFRLNVSVSDNKTIQRKVDEINTITNGNLNFQLRPNISYVVNQKLNIQAYFERTINDPKVSNSFRRATTRFGIQIRFSLAQ
jgi:cell surface protein SprA